MSRRLRSSCGATAAARASAYRDGTGNTIRDKAIKARINQLAIPPAWTEVCIAADERAHIQAIGRDAEGRLQYRYHPEWDKARATAKESRLKRLGSALPRVRDAVRKALAGPGLTRTKVVAAIVRLIDRALLAPAMRNMRAARAAEAHRRCSRAMSPSTATRWCWSSRARRQGDQARAARPVARARSAQAVSCGGSAFSASPTAMAASSR